MDKTSRYKLPWIVLIGIGLMACALSSLLWQKSLVQEKKGMSFKAGQASRPPLKLLLQLCHELGAGGPSKERAVIPVRQLHDTLIKVPTGYIHLVHNLAPPVKVAWDLYDASNFHLYLQARRIANGQYFGSANADNYVAGPSVVIELSKAFVQQPPPARGAKLGKSKAQAGSENAHKIQGWVAE